MPCHVSNKLIIFITDENHESATRSFSITQFSLIFTHRRIYRRAARAQGLCGCSGELPIHGESTVEFVRVRERRRKTNM